jgi:hypothetical protein
MRTSKKSLVELQRDILPVRGSRVNVAIGVELAWNAGEESAK